MLKAYEFRGEAEIANLEAGPGALVSQNVEDGRLALCVSEKLFERLYKRAPTDRERLFELPRFADAFVASDYDFKALVKTMVTDPGYRRMAR